MKYLLDVNILIAWGWADHSDFLKVSRWLLKIHNDKSTRFLTTPITQMGFIRISVQRSSSDLSILEACKILSEMIHFFGKQHEFIPDTIESLIFPAWCKSANRTTDAHLLKLAESHKARLATLDQKIPGAFVIP